MDDAPVLARLVDVISSFSAAAVFASFDFFDPEDLDLVSDADPEDSDLVSDADPEDLDSRVARARVFPISATASRPPVPIVRANSSDEMTSLFRISFPAPPPMAMDPNDAALVALVSRHEM